MLIEALEAPANRLGECPLWCDRTRHLWWVDVLEPCLWSYNPVNGRCERHPIQARRLGSIALRREGGLILACEDGLYAYDPDTGHQTFLVDPEPSRPGHRKNDGRADPLGNFWVGTLREDSYAPVGALYCISPDLSVTLHAEHLQIPNALAFDPERRRMYYGDTRAYLIWACDYDPATGEIGERRIFATTNAPARPDGSCVDAEGYLWNAQYAGGRLVRYAPSGEISLSLDLPVSHPTCCCFGGDDLEKLYVTSASEPLSAQGCQRERLAGRVLVIDAGIHGRPEFRVNF
jgi:sugar lactone lactonase YvrE